MLPQGVDWIGVIRPSILLFLDNGNPYSIDVGWLKTLFPFWTFILLSPFALLPVEIGRILLFIISVASFGYSAIKLGATKLQLIMFMLSAPVIGCLNNGNIDWLVVTGMWMPPQVGLFFVLMKPQIGLCLAAYWAYETVRQGGIRKFIVTFTPVTVFYIISFLLYGPWLFSFSNMGANPENVSAFPFTIPMGLLLFYISLKRKEVNLSIFSSPLLAPYTSLFSYSTGLLGLFNRPKMFIAMWIALWIIVAVRYFV